MWTAAAKEKPWMKDLDMKLVRKPMRIKPMAMRIKPPAKQEVVATPT